MLCLFLSGHFTQGLLYTEQPGPDVKPMHTISNDLTTAESPHLTSHHGQGHGRQGRFIIFSWPNRCPRFSCCKGTGYWYERTRTSYSRQQDNSVHLARSERLIRHFVSNVCVGKMKPVSKSDIEEAIVTE